LFYKGHQSRQYVEITSANLLAVAMAALDKKLHALGCKLICALKASDISWCSSHCIHIRVLHITVSILAINSRRPWDLPSTGGRVRLFRYITFCVLIYADTHIFHGALCVIFISNPRRIFHFSVGQKRSERDGN